MTARNDPEDIMQDLAAGMQVAQDMGYHVIVTDQVLGNKNFSDYRPKWPYAMVTLRGNDVFDTEPIAKTADSKVLFAARQSIKVPPRSKRLPFRHNPYQAMGVLIPFKRTFPGSHDGVFKFKSHRDQTIEQLRRAFIRKMFGSNYMRRRNYEKIYMVPATFVEEAFKRIRLYMIRKKRPAPEVLRALDVFIRVLMKNPTDAIRFKKYKALLPKMLKFYEQKVHLFNTIDDYTAFRKDLTGLDVDDDDNAYFDERLSKHDEKRRTLRQTQRAIAKIRRSRLSDSDSDDE